MSVQNIKIATVNNSAKVRSDSRSTLASHKANEIFIAIVGAVGAGGSRAAEVLNKYFASTDIGGKKYQCKIVKASDSIKEFSVKKNLELPSVAGKKSLEAISMMQDRGDDMRRMEEDDAAVIVSVVQKIRKLRAELTKTPSVPGAPVLPDGIPRVYIIDSLRHPAEAHLLRQLYGDAFALIGVVCDERERERRLRERLFLKEDWGRPETMAAVRKFMERDENDSGQSYGQHVRDVFQESDFFIDNTLIDEKNDLGLMNDDLARLIDLITHAKILRPTIAETAMHHAYSAMLRSACLSRQVGAALVDGGGSVVATGTNEVPKAGGGVYGEGFSEEKHDSRCAFHNTPACSNNIEQNRIIKELIKMFPALGDGKTEEQAIQQIRRTRIGGLLEFSRSVHAEMDALLSAARAGVSPVGTRLFVTTFPCHYCARHIVSAGVYEVQYIEPYPKSLALDLHSDSICNDYSKWVPPAVLDVRTEHEKFTGAGEKKVTRPAVGALDSVLDHGKVLFRPFVGVAPRLYARTFLKDREYKDKLTGELHIQEPEWGGKWSLSKLSYPHLEAELAEGETE